MVIVMVVVAKVIIATIRIIVMPISLIVIVNGGINAIGSTAHNQCSGFLSNVLHIHQSNHSNC